jgi:phage shock protein C
MMMKKRLYKDHSNQKISGVCSGIAKYFDLDPTIVRLALVLFCALGGSGIVAYIVCAIVMPDEPGYIEED